VEVLDVYLAHVVLDGGKEKARECGPRGRKKPLPEGVPGEMKKMGGRRLPGAV
jgi:hypothetical protein